MDPKQHVLIIGKVWPEPSSSAAGSRTLQLVNLFIAQHWQVSFACAAGTSEFSTDLRHLGIQTFNIELNHSGFDSFIKSLNPSMVLFDRFTTEEQFGWRVADFCPTALRILDTIDLHCLRAARHLALKENRDFEWKDLVNDVAKRELASIYRCDLSLMISEVEIDILRTHFRVDDSLLHYTPFLPEPITPAEKTQWPDYATRSHFVTIGNFLHEPNWDSVLYLKQNIWPLIRKQLPKAELHVYGSYPSQKVFQLHHPKDGFIIKGRAESVKEVMLHARLCLAPLRFGAGMKGKLLDAMLFGAPSVTTPTGAESMHGTLPWNGAVANTPEELAQAAVNLYTDKYLWQQAQENGLTIIRDHFSKVEHEKKLIRTISNIQNSFEEHRLNNFTGAMLMHHQLTGTKYMALWIEAKNKLNQQ